MTRFLMYVRTWNSEIIAAMKEWRLKQVPPLEPKEAIAGLLRRCLTVEAF